MKLKIQRKEMKHLYMVLVILFLCQCGNEKVTPAKEEGRVVEIEQAKGVERPGRKEEVSSTAEDLKNDEVLAKENIDLKDKPDDVLKEVEPNTYMDPFDPDFITGKWEAEDYDEVSFGAWFFVEDGYVSGQYCAMKVDASRIDCGTHEEVDMCYVKSPYLVGAKQLELEVVSCYSQKKGKATIEPYGDGDLLWTLTETPGKYGVDHFAPETAVLRKTHFDPWE